MKKLALVIVFIGIASSSGKTVMALDWTSNLLQNSGAENGSLSGWTTDDTAVVRSVKSRQEASGLVLPHSGEWFFDMTKLSVGSWGQMATRILYQNIDITSYAFHADIGNISVKAEMYLQTEDVPEFSGIDYGQMTLYFLDNQQTTLSALSTGLVQSPNLVWTYESLQSTVPAGTRTLRLELLGEKHEGDYINAFFDDISVHLAVVPEPATLFLALLGTIGLKLWTPSRQ